MTRFSDIMRGAQLKAAQDRYLQYRATARGARVGTRGDRPPQGKVGIIPFDLDIAADSLIPVNSPVAGITRLSATINLVPGLKVFSAEALNGKTLLTQVGFSPARVVTVEAATKTGVAATSAMTGQTYLKYTGTDRYSCAFGRDTVTSAKGMTTLFLALKTELQKRPNLQVNRVSLTPERFKF